MHKLTSEMRIGKNSGTSTIWVDNDGTFVQATFEPGWTMNAQEADELLAYFEQHIGDTFSVVLDGTTIVGTPHGVTVK